MTEVSWDLPGQPHAAAVLSGACARDDVGHAWAFVGPGGVGQEAAARTLAAALNCPQAVGGVPDGTCSTCRRSARGHHPVYFEFAPGGTMHRVVEVREQWLLAASRTVAEGRVKVLRIVDADKMNDPAANAFLKALEEPPPRTVWVLDIADPDELPETILSRCRTVRFVPWTTAALDAEARRLGLADPADRALAVRAALGSPAALARLAGEGGLDDLRAHRSIPRVLRARGPGWALVLSKALDEEVKRRTAALKAAGRAELAELAELSGDAMPRAVVKQVEDRAVRRERDARLSVLQAALDDLTGWYRDCLLAWGGGDAAVALHPDDLEAAAADAEAAGGPAELLRAVDRIAAVREDLELNAAPALAVEALFLEIATGVPPTRRRLVRPGRAGIA